MNKVLFWLYVINSVLIILHEMDSAYWQEWKLFKMKGGAAGFLFLHFPILLLLQYGLIPVYLSTRTGMIISLVLAFSGIFAFSIHTWFIKKGGAEFKTPASRIILFSTLIISFLQLLVTLILLWQ
ncbi:MAG: hypothetical protein PHF84_05380 [bacterium]|nr:hypothetical protein [bacterium]